MAITPTRSNDLLNEFLTNHPSLVTKMQNHARVRDYDAVLVDTKTKPKPSLCGTKPNSKVFT